MYTHYFSLSEMPFSITPDPAYLYMSPRHQEALGHLLYGTGQYGGFVQLTGEVGTGKTTIIRTLLEQKLESVDVASVHNPKQSELEFVQSICDELHVKYPDLPMTLKSLIDSLNRHLLAAHANGRRVVLIIDEAQNLDPSVLEQLRLLTNLETHKEKLLRIMLVGQPELQDLLARPDLRQLAQRITARYHLTPLTEVETGEYVRHRLRVAGAGGDIFGPDALKMVYIKGRGIPRLINIICDRALLGAYSLNERTVSEDVVVQAAAEAVAGFEERRGPARGRRREDRPGFWVSTEKVWAVLAVTFASLFFYQQYRGPLSDALLPPAASTPVRAVPAKTADSAALKPFATVSDAATLALQSAQPLSIVMNELIGLWDSKLHLPPGENVCRALHQRNLECYRSQGKWNDLGNLNRPAILTLITPGSEQRHALLRALSTTHATLQTSTGTQNVPLAQLDGLWSGEFMLLWRRETGDITVGPTTRGDDVIWLRKRLLQIRGATPAPFLSAFYDDSLATSVRRFQRTRGLEPDGVAGTRTLIALGDRQADTPTLADAVTP